MLAALVINRSGGIRHSPDPKIPGTPADPRDFMWKPPPEPEATPEFLSDLFGVTPPVKKHGKKAKNTNGKASRS